MLTTFICPRGQGSPYLLTTRRRLDADVDHRPPDVDDTRPHFGSGMTPLPHPRAAAAEASAGHWAWWIDPPVMSACKLWSVLED